MKLLSRAIEDQFKLWLHEASALKRVINSDKRWKSSPVYNNLQIPEDTQFLIIDKGECEICLQYFTFPTYLHYHKAIIMNYLNIM